MKNQRVILCNISIKFIVSFQWVPPPQESIKEKEAEEQIAIDLGDEYEQALSAATQEEIIDLAGKIIFKSLLELKDIQLYKIVSFFQLFLVSIL